MGNYKIVDLDYHGICTKAAGCTWEETMRVCEEEGGYLVEIRSKKENDQVTKLIAPFEKDIWIGFNDFKKQGDYRWVSDNSPKAYHNFRRGNYILTTSTMHIN